MYKLDGEPYDGISAITQTGPHTLTITATNDLMSTTKSYSFNIIPNTAPAIVQPLKDISAKPNQLVTLDL